MASGTVSSPRAASPRADGPERAVRSPYLPAQQRAIDLLGRRSANRPPVSEAFLVDLSEAIELALAPTLASVPATRPLVVGKSAIHAVESCPERWLRSLDTPFRWSVVAVLGTVAHKAIELGANWRGPADPAQLVDAAIDHLVDGPSSAGGYLRTLSTVELAELRGGAVARVTAFEECFPPLQPRWRPVLEGRLRVEVGGGRLVLVGRPDLTLGRPGHGGKVLVDLKSGRRDAAHAADLAFYALLDALRLGVAPRRVATVYLDRGMPDADDVTEPMLIDAADRMVGAVGSMVALRDGSRPSALRSGPGCRWCPARTSCVAGLEWARGIDDELAA